MWILEIRTRRDTPPMKIRRATPTWTNETFVIYYVQWNQLSNVLFEEWCLIVMLMNGYHCLNYIIIDDDTVLLIHNLLYLVFMWICFEKAFVCKKTNLYCTYIFTQILLKPRSIVVCNQSSTYCKYFSEMMDTVSVITFVFTFKAWEAWFENV